MAHKKAWVAITVALISGVSLMVGRWFQKSANAEQPAVEAGRDNNTVNIGNGNRDMNGNIGNSNSGTGTQNNVTGTQNNISIDSSKKEQRNITVNKGDYVEGNKTVGK